MATITLTTQQVHYIQNILQPKLTALAGVPSNPNTNSEDGMSGNSFLSGETALVQAILTALAAGG